MHTSITRRGGRHQFVGLLTHALWLGDHTFLRLPRDSSSDWLSPKKQGISTYSGGTVRDSHPVILFSISGSSPVIPRNGLSTCLNQNIIKDKKPKILVLDDSTSAVDTKTDALIRKAFAEEIPDTTKIIIAQRVASVEHADKIVVLDGGKIESIGKHDELIKSSPIYREIYESQNKGGGADGEDAE